MCVSLPVHNDNKMTDGVEAKEKTTVTGKKVMGKVVLGKRGERVVSFGYYLTQLNEDEVDGVDLADSKEQVFAAGPTAVLIHKGTYFSLSGMWETEVENRPEGFKTVFRIVYKFR